MSTPSTASESAALPTAAPSLGESPAKAQSLSQWFTEEVHAHDGQLKAYLRGAFPAIHDVDDVVQESYLRIWKARAKEPIESAKALLFKIARHLAVDYLRHDRASPMDALGNLTALDVLDEKPSVPELVSRLEKARLLAEALVTLPPRCRQIIMLRELKGWSRVEVARHLRIAEKTVDAQVDRGIDKLEDYLRRRGVAAHGR